MGRVPSVFVGLQRAYHSHHGKIYIRVTKTRVRVIK